MQLMGLLMEFSKVMGYDYAVTMPVVPLPRTDLLLLKSPQQDGKIQGWQNEHRGFISFPICQR